MRRNPRLSIRRLSARTGIPRATVHRAVRQVLRLHPYKLQLVQSLHRGDKRRRVEFSQWLLQKWSSASFRKGLIVSDEANFYLSGTVNKQNCPVWGLENPHITLESDIQSPHLTVWCGLCSRGIIGPYFFFEGGHSVTVTSSRYRCMLEDFLLPELRRKRISRRKAWLQQDGATPHTALSVLNFLQSKFPGKVISKGGDFRWPPRSPDLSPLDFFLWGYLKTEVYRTPPRSLRELKRRIIAALRATPLEAIKNALNALPLRCLQCRRRRGGHIEGLLPCRQ